LQEEMAERHCPHGLLEDWVLAEPLPQTDHPLQAYQPDFHCVLAAEEAEDPMSRAETVVMEETAGYTAEEAEEAELLLMDQLFLEKAGTGLRA
jgi:hypothetical protein